ncbi:MAG TPA: DEAD/DEAH box helicase, partial [Actinomycetota bacterium]|nr:DEAD/DEAH box helicase [Actinomycetota bacterium]
MGWPAIARGEHTLILAPTGSGKTLAAFLWAIDRLANEPPPDPRERCRALYVSPLRALAVDVEKNLRAPLAGIRHAAERLGAPLPHDPSVAIRTGDTPAEERRALLRRPPDLLITTPESLYLMLTSSARETLRGVRWVIVDEIHAVAGNKRGAHLALSLERLEAIADRPPQRIGLSATQRPLDEVARFLGGRTEGGWRPVTVVDAGGRKPLEVEVVVPVEDLARLVRRAANFAELPDDLLEAVLDLLAGRYPSDAFAGLRPRIAWDRARGTVRGREGARRLAVTNPGTIPDLGLFGVFLPDGTRVGELDEEMVFESRPGEVFVLGASSWRIEEITRDRVIVTPAPGEPGKTPFWHGDAPAREPELGRALGALVRELAEAPADRALARLTEEHRLDPLAARNLLAYLAEQREATGALPDDRTIVVERFPDELGDHRVCVLTPFGERVHAPWALAIERRLSERLGAPVQALWSDDGIAIRLPEAVDRVPTEDLLFDPEEIEERVVEALPGSQLFAAVFREAAARALLLPRRRPGQRTPLWMQRQRAADLLAVASTHPGFPILLEATRECLRDVFDVPALRELLRDVRARRVRVVAVDTPRASPFARSLVFRWTSVYMYEGDAPLAERRAQALALDRDLLRELLGAEELRELLDPRAVEELELELQGLAEGRRARGPDDLHDLLRRVGDLTPAEVRARCAGDPDPWLRALEAERRVVRVRVAGEERIAAAEDAARLRDALGVVLPPGLPAAYTEPVARPLVDLVSRYARTHGPFLASEAAARLGAPVERVREVLAALEAEGRVVRGEFRPGGVEREWCDAGVLRALRRRSLALLRREVEPVEAAALGRFLPAWQGITAPRSGPDALLEVLGQLQGAAIPASTLEAEVLPLRVRGYLPADLDALLAAGEVVWVGAGRIGAEDGRVALLFRDRAPYLAPAAAEARPEGAVHDAIRRHLAERGASFWPELVRAAGTADERVVLGALWDLVWAGEVTNDTLAPLRSYLAAGRRAPRPGR